MSDTVKLIKRAALEAVEASQPSGIFFGSVKALNPFKIALEQKLIIDSSSLIYLTEKPSEAYSVGDAVVMIRVQGGQKFVVLGKAY